MTTVIPLYKGRKRLTDAVIRTVSGSQYSHAELACGDTPTVVMECIGASKRDNHQVRRKTIEFHADHWDFMIIEGLDFAPMWTRAEQELGAPYDSIGAVLSVTPFGRSANGAWFCFELLGVLMGFDNPHRLHPRAFVLAALKSFDCVRILPGSTLLSSDILTRKEYTYGV